MTSKFLKDSNPINVGKAADFVYYIFIPCDFLATNYLLTKEKDSKKRNLKWDSMKKNSKETMPFPMNT